MRTDANRREADHENARTDRGDRLDLHRGVLPTYQRGGGAPAGRFGGGPTPPGLAQLRRHRPLQPARGPVGGVRPAAGRGRRPGAGRRRGDRALRQHPARFRRGPSGQDRPADPAYRGRDGRRDPPPGSGARRPAGNPRHHGGAFPQGAPRGSRTAGRPSRARPTGPSSTTPSGTSCSGDSSTPPPRTGSWRSSTAWPAGAPRA